MLTLTKLSLKVNSTPMALIPNPNHPLGMGLAYRLLKEQGWKNHNDEMHPIERVPVFRLTTATIRRNRSGRSHWLIEIGGVLYESSAGAVELTAAVRERLRSERAKEQGWPGLDEEAF